MDDADKFVHILQTFVRFKPNVKLTKELIQIMETDVFLRENEEKYKCIPLN